MAAKDRVMLQGQRKAWTGMRELSLAAPRFGSVLGRSLGTAPLQGRPRSISISSLTP